MYPPVNLLLMNALREVLDKASGRRVQPSRGMCSRHYQEQLLRPPAIDTLQETPSSRDDMRHGGVALLLLFR